MGAQRSEAKGCASRTRGIVAGGYYPSSDRNDIYVITMASLGNSTSFGNLGANVSEHAALSDSTRGIFAGGKPAGTKTIEYITIAAEGNA